MKTRTPIKWNSNAGKTRTGIYITKFAARKGYCLVHGDDGRQHIMRCDKIQRREEINE